jgi:hypothetical protein
MSVCSFRPILLQVDDTEVPVCDDAAHRFGTLKGARLQLFYVLGRGCHSRLPPRADWLLVPNLGHTSDSDSQ